MAAYADDFLKAQEGAGAPGGAPQAPQAPQTAVRKPRTKNGAKHVSDKLEHMLKTFVLAISKNNTIQKLFGCRINPALFVDGPVDKV